jgi:hypothetical protein
MSQKKAGKKKGKNVAAQTVGAIEIQALNYIVDPDPVSYDAGSPVVWFVTNNDVEDHSVSIDPSTVKLKGNGVGQNPFTTKKPLVATPDPVAANGGKSLITATLKGKGNFPDKHTMYKYEIASVTADGVETRLLDPDLEVVDPTA